MHLVRSASLLLLLPSLLLAQEDLAARVERARLERHVRALAGPAMEGRREGPGMELARRYVLEHFQAAGLLPKGSEGFVQRFGPQGEGQNLIGLLPGQDPALKDEVVILSAHYDHLGRRGAHTFFGADDNASGVAAMLEVARVLSAGGARPRRSVLFIAFDQEERWLVGSMHWVAQPTVPLQQVALCINLDMLGRNLGDIVADYLFVLGSEHTPALKRPVLEAARGLAIKPGLVGTDLIGIRGDYGPFRARRIPYLFFSNGEHSDYHRPTDTPERILYDKLRAGTQLVLRTTLAAADLPLRPTFEDPRPDVIEAEVLADVLSKLLPQARAFGLGGPDLAVMELRQGCAQDVVRAGRITPEQREVLKLGVQAMLANIRSMLRGVMGPRRD